MITKCKNPEDLLDKGALLTILTAVGVASVAAVYVFKEIKKKREGQSLARLGQLPSREHIRMAGTLILPDAGDCSKK